MMLVLALPGLGEHTTKDALSMRPQFLSAISRDVGAAVEAALLPFTLLSFN